MVKAIEELTVIGYTVKFSVTEDGLLDDGNGHTFLSSEVELNEFHRFGGDTNSSDYYLLFVLQIIR